MRYFYTDPLAAAWMGHHFGMRFLDGDGNELERDEIFFLFFQPDDPTDDQPEWDGKHFIHPESLHLLEPQVGDIYEWVIYAEKPYSDRGLSRVKNGEHATRVLECVFKDDTGMISFPRIIQRNGVAFHWPESEGYEQKA